MLAADFSAADVLEVSKNFWKKILRAYLLSIGYVLIVGFFCMGNRNTRNIHLQDLTIY